MSKLPTIFVAFDFADLESAQNLLAKLEPNQCGIKIGSEMFVRFGPAFVKEVIARDFSVFLDLKFHDIPNTVARACRAAAELGVSMLTLHALGGQTMLAAANEVLAAFPEEQRPKLLAVTILTSLAGKDLTSIGLNNQVSDHVEQLTKLAVQAGIDGIVCSPLELSKLRTIYNEDLRIVTPGIRLQPDVNRQDDQQRMATPRMAIESGANHLVIGRPITRALDPMQVLQKIMLDIQQVSVSQ